MSPLRSADPESLRTAPLANVADVSPPPDACWYTSLIYQDSKFPFESPMYVPSGITSLPEPTPKSVPFGQPAINTELHTITAAAKRQYLMMLSLCDTHI